MKRTGVVLGVLPTTSMAIAKEIESNLAEMFPEVVFAIAANVVSSVVFEFEDGEHEPV